MTITARSDKIAPVADDGDATAQQTSSAGDAEAEPVADDGDATAQQTSSAGDAEAERPGNRKAKKLLTKPFRCDNLYRLSLEADRKESG